MTLNSWTTNSLADSTGKLGPAKRSTLIENLITKALEEERAKRKVY